MKCLDSNLIDKKATILFVVMATINNNNMLIEDTKRLHKHYKLLCLLMVSDIIVVLSTWST